MHDEPGDEASRMKNPIEALFATPVQQPTQLKFDLPGFWGVSNTAVPTEVTKTNIFNVSCYKGGARTFYERHVEFFSSLKSCQCFYRGPALDQRDADVWIACLSLWKQNPSKHNQVEIRIGDIAKKLGLVSSGGKAYSLIRASIDRLYKSNVKYVSINPQGKREVKEFHLISGLEYTFQNDEGELILANNANNPSEYILEDGEDFADEIDIDDGEDRDVPSLIKSGAKKFKFMVDPNMQRLFEQVSWTDFDKRKLLSSHTAKSIEFYAIGHQRGVTHRIGYDKLAQICGRKYDTKANRHAFRASVKQSLVELNLVKIMESYTVHETHVEWIVSKDLQIPVEHDRKAVKQLSRAGKKSSTKKISWNSVTQDDLEDFMQAKLQQEMEYKTLLRERMDREKKIDAEIIKRQIVIDWLQMGKAPFIDILVNDAELLKLTPP